MEEEQFQVRPMPGEKDAGGDMSEDMTAVRLRFTEAAGYQVLDFFAEEDIVRQKDGGFEVEDCFFTWQVADRLYFILRRGCQGPGAGMAESADRKGGGKDSGTLPYMT